MKVTIFIILMCQTYKAMVSNQEIPQGITENTQTETNLERKVHFPNWHYKESLPGSPHLTLTVLTDDGITEVVVTYNLTNISPHLPVTCDFGKVR